MRINAPLVTIGLALLAACASDPPGPEALAQSELRSRCAAAADHVASCKIDGATPDVSECVRVFSIVRGDVATPFFDCVDDATCRQIADGDVCETILDSAQPLAVHRAFASGCQRRTAECSGVAFDCKADDLRRLDMFTEEFMTPAVACWSKPCDQIEDCLYSTLSAL
jgi:hypothetical protein